jgi:hypothetical protein
VAIKRFRGIEYPWPKLGERVFDSDGEVHTTVSVTMLWDGRWLGYAEGYRRAAGRLVQQYVTGGFNEDHSYIGYPVAFLYRHALELRIKHVLLLGNALIGSPLDFTDRHDLVGLWSECEAVLRQLWSAGQDEDFAAITDQIAQFSEVDPDGFRFRYPVTTARSGSRQPSLDSTFREFGLRTFAERMEGLIGFFDGAETGIMEALDAKQREAAEYANWVEMPDPEDWGAPDPEDWGAE